MSGVRQLTRSDIPEIANLFIDVFRSGAVSQERIVCEYMEKVYFEAPWSDPNIGSLVSTDKSGEIIGFLGVFPRRVWSDGRCFNVAVPGNFMFRQEARSAYPLGAVQLIREFLAGPQDLSISDTATEESRKLWEVCGGDTARLYSFHWYYPVRPFSHMLHEI